MNERELAELIRLLLLYEEHYEFNEYTRWVIKGCRLMRIEELKILLENAQKELNPYE